LQATAAVCEIGIRAASLSALGSLPPSQVQAPTRHIRPLLRSLEDRADWKTGMKKKSSHPDFDQTLDLLRSHSFEVVPFPAIPGGMLVSKHGAGAVLVAAGDAPADAPAAFAVSPGLLVRGEVGRLLDRGYQKFIKTSQYEIPASATQLQAIHAFSEELKQVSGAISLYNESLGTTSDLYEYDRLNGREHADPPAARPWELADGH
jgi:hypothetical protein